MITPQEIISLSRTLNISQPNVVEKDWVLSHLLNIIYNSNLLIQSLSFKGGTSLRKCWFPNYRFSEDLDFTLIGDKLDSIEVLKNELELVKEKLSDEGIRIENIELTQTLNCNDGKAFLAKLSYRAVLPVSSILPKVILDFSSYENILLASVKRKIIHPYSDQDLIANEVTSYSLEEILAEKLRTILQRFYPRDIYDVYSILLNGTFNNSSIKNLFYSKCEYKKVRFSSVDDFFDEIRLQNANKAWANSLRHLIYNLPAFNYVISKLKQLIPALLK